MVGVGRAATFFSRDAAVVETSGPPLTYEPTTPPELQRRDWTCAICSTHWALASLGWVIDRDELIAYMTPWPVSPAVGCLDASGAGLAQFLRDSYGLPARNQAVVTFDMVLDRAGRYPLLMGGRGWNHWTAVCARAGDTLLLCNPAPGYRGIYQSMSRGQFDSWLGSFSLVEVAWG